MYGDITHKVLKYSVSFQRVFANSTSRDDKTADTPEVLNYADIS
jgi:hypothetical protein